MVLCGGEFDLFLNAGERFGHRHVDVLVGDAARDILLPHGDRAALGAVDLEADGFEFDGHALDWASQSPVALHDCAFGNSRLEHFGEHRQCRVFRRRGGA